MKRKYIDIYYFIDFVLFILLAHIHIVVVVVVVTNRITVQEI